MAAPYALERQLALAAVRRACALVASVAATLAPADAAAKPDTSPVTVGDYAAQALIGTILARALPADAIVGEEDAGALRADAAAALRARVVELANAALEAPLAPGEDTAWGVGPGARQTSEALLAAIDRGNHPGGRTGRLWALDPIDGTKGFLRGGQYAVCLALIVDARVQVGVIGCPNLPADAARPDGPRGCVFVAVRGQGAHQLPLAGATSDTGARLAIPAFTKEALNFLESVEAAHASHGFNARVATLLGVTRAPARMDSQAKYCALARGDGGAYLRMPTGVGYREKIWDHAAGALLVSEAGGVVTDSRGLPLDFGLGRTLGENFGVVAAGRETHARVLEAVKRVAQEVAAKA